MNELLRAVGLILAVVCATPLHASTADWWVVDDKSERGAIELSKGDTATFASLVPRQLYLLEEDIAFGDGKYHIPAGTLFISVDGMNTGKVCAMERHLGSAFHCLADRNGDGSYETYYYQQVFNEFYFGSTFKPGKPEQISQDAKLRELNPLRDIAPIALDIRFDSGKPGSRVSFKLCVNEPSGALRWKKGLYKGVCLKNKFSVDVKDGAATVPLFGGKLQIEPLDRQQIRVSWRSAERVSPVTFNGTLF